MSMRVTRPDVEEVSPGRFRIRDGRARPLLKGEGELTNQLFVLHSWRRTGLMARLRAIGLSVLTLDDQIAALPSLPPPPRDDRIGWRALVSPQERYSAFDLEQLTWQPAAPTMHNGAAGVSFVHGHPIRRRKGHGPPDFYLAQVTPTGSLELRPRSEHQAVLHGYACAAPLNLQIEAVQEQAGWRLPPMELPAPHLALLGRLGATEAPLLIPTASQELAVAVLERLGLTLILPRR